MNSGRVSLAAVSQALDTLTDDERAALRASRFHSPPAASASPDRRCRLAHPGGALATNKAAALAKFLKRKLQQDGAASLDPDLVERAVANAKAASSRSGPTLGGGNIRHVDSFSDPDEVREKKSKLKKQKHGGGAGKSDKKKIKKKMKKRRKDLNGKQTPSSKTKGGKKKKQKLLLKSSANGHGQQ